MDHTVLWSVFTGGGEKATLSVDPCSSYPCCSRADCKLILSSPTHCRRYSRQKSKEGGFATVQEKGQSRTCRRDNQGGEVGSRGDGVSSDKAVLSLF